MGLICNVVLLSKLFSLYFFLNSLFESFAKYFQVAVLIYWSFPFLTCTRTVLEPLPFLTRLLLTVYPALFHFRCIGFVDFLLTFPQYFLSSARTCFLGTNMTDTKTRFRFLSWFTRLKEMVCTSLYSTSHKQRIYNRWLSDSIRGCIRPNVRRDDAKSAEILITEHNGHCPAI